MADRLPQVVPSAAPQPVGVPWPTREWPTAEPPARLAEVVAAAFEDPGLAETYAVLAIKGGTLVAERYGGELPSFVHPPTPVRADTPLVSWSMAKSVLHAAVGLLVDDGRLDPDAPADVPEWPVGDPRSTITLRQLLQMRDGLSWVEDYEDETVSDVIEMLFGAGKDDVAAFAANRPLADAPGGSFNYSSGTSNIVARIVGRVVGPGQATAAFLRDRLFAPIGMGDAVIKLDDVGTFVASSFVYCTARSMARFATLYLRGGEWDGTRLLSRVWVDDAQRPTSEDVLASTYYSHHWWLDGTGTYWASGYEGQRAIITPADDSIVIRYGRTPEERYPALRAWADEMVLALR